MSDLPPSEPLLPVPTPATANTHCTAADYERLYAASIADPDVFWAEQAKRLDWVTPPTKIANWSFDPVSIKWYEDGVLNLCHNALDRHVAAGHGRSEEHTSELQSLMRNLVCRLLLEK